MQSEKISPLPGNKSYSSMVAAWATPQGTINQSAAAISSEAAAASTIQPSIRGKVSKKISDGAAATAGAVSAQHKQVQGKSHQKSASSVAPSRRRTFLNERGIAEIYRMLEQERSVVWHPDRNASTVQELKRPARLPEKITFTTAALLLDLLEEMTKEQLLYRTLTKEPFLEVVGGFAVSVLAQHDEIAPLVTRDVDLRLWMVDPHATLDRPEAIIAAKLGLSVEDLDKYYLENKVSNPATTFNFMGISDIDLSFFKGQESASQAPTYLDAGSSVAQCLTRSVLKAMALSIQEGEGVDRFLRTRRVLVEYYSVGAWPIQTVRNSLRNRTLLIYPEQLSPLDMKANFYFIKRITQGFLPFFACMTQYRNVFIPNLAGIVLKTPSELLTAPGSATAAGTATAAATGTTHAMRVSRFFTSQRFEPAARFSYLVNWIVENCALTSINPVARRALLVILAEELEGAIKDLELSLSREAAKGDREGILALMAQLRIHLRTPQQAIGGNQFKRHISYSVKEDSLHILLYHTPVDMTPFSSIWGEKRRCQNCFSRAIWDLVPELSYEEIRDQLEPLEIAQTILFEMVDEATMSPSDISRAILLGVVDQAMTASITSLSEREALNYLEPSEITTIASEHDEEVVVTEAASIVSEHNEEVAVTVVSVEPALIDRPTIAALEVSIDGDSGTSTGGDSNDADSLALSIDSDISSEFITSDVSESSALQSPSSSAASSDVSCALTLVASALEGDLELKNYSLTELHARAEQLKKNASNFERDMTQLFPFICNEIVKWTRASLNKPEELNELLDYLHEMWHLPWAGKPIVLKGVTLSKSISLTNRKSALFAKLPPNIFDRQIHLERFLSAGQVEQAWAWICLNKKLETAEVSLRILSHFVEHAPHAPQVREILRATPQSSPQIRALLERCIAQGRVDCEAEVLALGDKRTLILFLQKAPTVTLSFLQQLTQKGRLKKAEEAIVFAKYDQIFMGISWTKQLPILEEMFCLQRFSDAKVCSYWICGHVERLGSQQDPMRLFKLLDAMDKTVLGQSVAFKERSVGTRDHLFLCFQQLILTSPTSAGKVLLQPYLAALLVQMPDAIKLADLLPFEHIDPEAIGLFIWKHKLYQRNAAQKVAVWDKFSPLFMKKMLSDVDRALGIFEEIVPVERSLEVALALAQVLERVDQVERLSIIVPSGQREFEAFFWCKKTLQDPKAIGLDALLEESVVQLAKSREARKECALPLLRAALMLAETDKEFEKALKFLAEEVLHEKLTQGLIDIQAHKRFKSVKVFPATWVFLKRIFLAATERPDPSNRVVYEISKTILESSASWRGREEFCGFAALTAPKSSDFPKMLKDKVLGKDINTATLAYLELIRYSGGEAARTFLVEACLRKETPKVEPNDLGYAISVMLKLKGAHDEYFDLIAALIDSFHGTQSQFPYLSGLLNGLYGQLEDVEMDQLVVKHDEIFQRSWARAALQADYGSPYINIILYLHPHLQARFYGELFRRFFNEPVMTTRPMWASAESCRHACQYMERGHKTPTPELNQLYIRILKEFFASHRADKALYLEEILYVCTTTLSVEERQSLMNNVGVYMSKLEGVNKKNSTLLITKYAPEMLWV